MYLSDAGTFTEYGIVKAFAYAILDYAAPYRGRGSNRALETAFSIVSTCMENGYLDLSQKIIETAAIRLDKLEKSGSDIEDSKFQQYTIEYYMLRVYLAWLQGRLDIAERLFSKIPVSDNGTGQERVMDICYKIGNCALSRKQHDVSVKWLERALRACELIRHMGQSPVLSIKNKELMILHASVRAGLRLDTKEPNCFLSKALDALKIHYGGMFPVQVIQLELLGKEELDKNIFSQEYH
ncbi:Transcription factor [Aspergillus tubingensis]